MHRRSILSGLAIASAGLVALPVFAQSASGEAAMGEAEIKHAEQTGMVGSLSLASSRLAVEKATDDMVKKFAALEVAEQETVADVLMSMKMSADEAEGALKKPTDADVEAMLDDEGKQKLEELRGMSGEEFDKQYVAAQLEGHQKLLAIQEEYLTIGQNREHLNVAKLARGHIKEHIADLEDIQASMS
jgi:putative membrane protein